MTMTVSSPSSPIEPAAPAEVNAAALETTILRARQGWVSVDFRELWRYRELLWFLALRDIQLRYKQTALGAAWAIIQPVFTMLVFTIFFGKLGGMAKQETYPPYYLSVFCALLPWQLFANSLLQSGNSLVANERLITKVYFPRLLMPLSSVISGVLDFAIALVLLLGMMAASHVYPGWAVLTLPLFVLMAVIAALSVGLWLSALNVQYRDVRYAIPFLTQLWLFLSPVAYSVTELNKIPAKWRTICQALYGLNPMVGVIEGFKWGMLGGTKPPVVMMCVSAIAVLLLLVGGLYYFRRMEKTFADFV
jgi:lipopolysaccharide transport system permease protein